MPDTTFAALADVVVLDLSRALAGPHATMMLADLGATVIKVEHPDRGDDSRAYGPFIDSSIGAESLYFLACNRNKLSIGLDLKDPVELQLVKRLVAKADVLVENFRPGVMERLGLGDVELRDLNPGLVVLSITGFGHDGPEHTRTAYDQIAQGEAGLMSITGEDSDHPQRVGVPIADLLAGMQGAFGLLAALRERDRTGEGMVVRTSLLGAVIGIHAFQGTAWTVGGRVPEASGNHHPTIAPYGLFGCADGYVQIACGNERIWQRFCGAVGLDPTAGRYATNARRLANRDALVAEIERVFTHYTRDELEALLGAADVPAGRIRRIDEVYGWEQTRSQRLVASMQHPRLGAITVPANPLRFFRNERELELPGFDHAPDLDEHGKSIRSWAEGAGCGAPPSHHALVLDPGDLDKP